MRICLSLIFALFVALCSYGVNAEARCSTAWYPDWKLEVRERNAGAQIMERFLVGDELSEFVSAYNESPPKSDKKAGAVAVWVHAVMLKAHLERRLIGGTTAPTALVVWLDGKGCISETEVIPLLILDKLLQGIPFVAGPPA